MTLTVRQHAQTTKNGHGAPAVSLEEIAVANDSPYLAHREYTPY
jgi:hypothetical protein